ncbi:hypothetical protein GCM10022261_00690 [Brevibacterium daeguense]|uniref:DUF1707 domain-containing protein n=1 Tax=Brevibacterium daeguense TaxID=909936 RepID=A0ABP8EEX2_9MICO|nr:DUF1707 domain-containing protein [Brevibacterium daeguense]
MRTPRPTERPSFAQREAYRKVLAEGYAQGRLNEQELARRAGAAVHASTLADLEELIADLPRGSLPVPIEPAQRPRKRPGDGPTRRTGGRRARVLIAAALVGAFGGWVVGNITLDIQQAEAAAIALEELEREADGDGEDGLLNPALDSAQVFRVHAHAMDQEEASRIIIRGNGSTIDVPLEDRTIYNTVQVASDGSVKTRPGGTYEDEYPQAYFAPSALDPAVLATMVEKAPEIYEDVTGQAAHPTVALEVRAASNEYAGVAQGDPVVLARLGRDEYQSGGGAVVWTMTGEEILAVYEQ